MKIIVINGVAGSGKDTFVKMVQKHSSVGVANISSIDPVKELMQKCGWNPTDKNDLARATMASIKKSLVDLNDGPFWYIQTKIEQISWECPDVGIVFVHVREPEEIEKLKWAYKEDCMTVLVKRDVRVPNNPADSAVSKFKHDLTIDNYGSDRDLELKAMCLVEFLEVESESEMQSLLLAA
jgi:hypothetical protein